MDVSGLTDVLRRRLPHVLSATALAVGAAALYVLLAPPTYTSRSMLYITPHPAGPGTEGAAPPGGDLAIVDSQVAIIGSDALLRRVVETLSLDQDDEFGRPQPLAAAWARLGGPALAPRADIAVARLAHRLTVERAENTYIIAVRTRAGSPAKAAQIADAVTSLYLAHQAAARSDDERRANEMINSRLGDLREQVRQAEDRADDFKRRNRISASEGGGVDEQQLARLSSELAAAQAALAEAKARLDAARATAASDAALDTLPEAVRSPAVQRLRDQLVALARTEASLSGQLKSRHPVLVEARSELSEVRAQIKAELTRIIGALTIDLDVATNRTAALERAIGAGKAEVSRMATAQIKLRELEQDVATSRAVLGDFLQRSKQAHEEGQIAVPFARVVSPATTPVHPSAPDTLLVLGLAALAGLGFGVARAAAAEALDDTVRLRSGAASADPVRLTLPDLAPAAPRAGFFLRSARDGRAADAGADPGQALLAVSAPTRETETAFRQGILHLLSVVERDRHESYPSAVMLVGASADAGVACVALALAEAGVQAGERILLVDADSRVGRLSALLAADDGSGKDGSGDEVSTDGGSARAAPTWDALLAKPEALADQIQHDPESGLSFLPLAAADLGRLKRAERRQLAANLAAAALDFELVIIDGGTLSVDESASTLFPLTDTVVVAARAGATPQRHLDTVLRILATAEANVAGVVLTGVDPRALS